VKLLSDYLNVCDHNPPTLQTDGQTTYDSNTALCVASCGKNCIRLLGDASPRYPLDPPLGVSCPKAQQSSLVISCSRLARFPL